MNKEGKQILDKIYYLIVTALSLVTALAWNSAFQKFFENNKYLNKRGPWIYAILITGITIGLIVGFTKIVEKIEGEKKKLKL